MPITDPYDSYQIGMDGASVCDSFWLRNSEEDAMITAKNRWGRTPVRFLEVAMTPNSPPAVILEYDSVVVTVIGGAMTLRHCVAFLSGMLGGGISLGTSQLNTACMAFIETVNGQWGGGGFTKTKRQLIIGHSFGGACAELFGLAMLAQPGQWGVPEVVTFGSPKPGDADAARAARGLRLIRWMNEGDPVPRIYPDREESNVLRIITPLDLRCAGYGTVQWHGGAEIGNDGIVRAKVFPDRVAGDFASDLASWWFRLSGNPGHPHHAFEYFDRLRRLRDFEGELPPVVPPRNVEAENRPPRATLADLQAERRADIAALPPPTEVLPGSLMAGAEKFWTYKHEDGLYNVYFLGQFVCAHKSVGRAKKLCAGGNKMAANYLNSPLGDSDQMRAAMDNFLTAMDMGDV